MNKYSNVHLQINILAYVPSWFEQPCERGGGAWLRFKKIYELANKVNVNYQLVKFRLDHQRPFILGILIMLISMIKGLFQSFNVVKQKNIQLILSPVELPHPIILAYLSSKITRRRSVAFLNTLPFYGLIEVPISEKKDRISYESILRIMMMVRRSRLRAILGAFIYYVSLKILCSSSIHIVCLSPVLAEELSKLNIRGNIATIYPGNGTYYNEISSTIRPNKNRYDAIYAAGNLHPQKGVLGAIKIWKRIVEKYPYAKLAIVGKVHHQHPSLAKDLNQIIQALGLNQNITILCDLSKGVTQKELWYMMKSAKIFLYPSKKDVWPLVVGEALACGLPVVAYDLPGIAYAYGGCPAVFLTKIGDIEEAAKIVIKLLNNESLREELSRKAVDYAQNHDWNHVVELEKKAYITVLREKAGHLVKTQTMAKKS